MREEQLRNLLSRADEGLAPRLAPPHELGSRVRELHRRRARRARIAGTASAILLLVAGMIGWRVGLHLRAGPDDRRGAEVAMLPHGAQGGANAAPVPAGDGQRAAGTPPEGALDDMVRLAAEAEFHVQVARRMIADRAAEQAAERRRRELALPDPLEEIRERLDRVAFRMVYDADRLREAMQPPEASIAIYRDVIRLFPTTHSAQLARERLTALGESRGDS